MSQSRRNFLKAAAVAPLVAALPATAAGSAAEPQAIVLTKTFVNELGVVFPANSVLFQLPDTKQYARLGMSVCGDACIASLRGVECKPVRDDKTYIVELWNNHAEEDRADGHPIERVIDFGILQDYEVRIMTDGDD